MIVARGNALVLNLNSEYKSGKRGFPGEEALVVSRLAFDHRDCSWRLVFADYLNRL